MPRATTRSKLAPGAQPRSSIRPTRTRRAASTSPMSGARRRRVSATIASEASTAQTSKPRRARKTALRPPAQPRSSTRTARGSGKSETSLARRTSGSRAAKRSTFSGDSQKAFFTAAAGSCLVARRRLPFSLPGGVDTPAGRKPGTWTSGHFHLEMRFDEPEPLVDAARNLREEVRRAPIAESVGIVDRAADARRERRKRRRKRFRMPAALGDAERILLQIRSARHDPRRPLRDTPELNRALGDQIHVLGDRRMNLVEELVERDEVRPLDVPVRGLGLCLEIHGVGQKLVQELGEL